MGNHVGLGKAGYLCAVLLLIAVVAMAQDEEPLEADRPDLTEGATTVGHLRFHIETSFAWERFDGDIEENEYFMSTLLRFGFGDHFEFLLETDAFTRLDIGDDEDLTGFSPIAIGIRYNLFEGESIGDMTLGYIMMAEIPSGTDEFETEDTEVTMRLAAEWDFSETLSLGTNVGLESQTDDSGESFYSFLASAVLGIAFDDQWGGLVEIAVDSAESDEGDAIWLFDVGLTFLVNPDLQLDVAAGTGLSGDEAPDFFMTTGLSIRF